MDSASIPKPHIRLAEAEDLGGLVDIENRCFTSDRVSRRSFRRFLDSATAILLVAERDGKLVGYALVLIRKGTALARLYSLAVDPAAQRGGIAAALMAACEREAFEADRFVLRLEVRVDNDTALHLYQKSGYREIDRVEEYYEDGCAALRMEKMLRGAPVAAGKAPYYPQTTEFTCGPACLIMGLSYFDADFVADTLTELTLWREATTIYLASGHGGCGPSGLACSAARRGLDVEVRLNPDQALFLNSVRDPEKQKVMQLVQEGYRQDGEALGVRYSTEVLSARALADIVQQGTMALVLVSGYRMFGSREPHWVLVHDSDARHLIIHDPWLEHEQHESPADAASLPIPDGEFERMARWGRTGVRAQVLLRQKA